MVAWVNSRLFFKINTSVS